MRLEFNIFNIHVGNAMEIVGFSFLEVFWLKTSNLTVRVQINRSSYE